MVSSARNPRPVRSIAEPFLSRRMPLLDEPAMRRPMSRVLMVDDAGLFKMLEASFLRRLGCEIQRAQDGSDIIRKATDAAPSVILLDSQRPNLDGPGCVRALKADPSLRTIPVLVVSRGDDVKACCEAGADVTLARPLEPGALEQALSSLGRLAHREGRRRSARGWVQVTRVSDSRRGRLKDISRSGLFLALSEPLPTDERIGVSLRLAGPEGWRQVRAQGVVVRKVMQDPDSHLIPGVGVRFIQIDPRDERHIEIYANGSVVESDWPRDRASGDDGRA
jgi:two-component system, cell cycle response regulator DivK